MSLQLCSTRLLLFRVYVVRAGLVSHPGLTRREPGPPQSGSGTEPCETERVHTTGH